MIKKFVSPLSFGLLALVLSKALPVAAAEWQFAVDVPGTKVHAILWIPPECSHVRGILLGQQVILEDKFLEDPIIRAAGGKECLAFVLMNRGAYGEFNYDPQAPVEKRDDLLLEKALDLLAADSGYSEIATAPLLPFGHSGAAIAAWHIGYWNPKRTIAILTLHASAIPPPYWDSKANVDGVPVLALTGQFESWGNPNVPLDMHWRWLRGGLLEMRASQQRALMSMLVDPGAGHFSLSEPVVKYIAMFLEAAVEERVPVSVTGDGPVALHAIPLNSGWLTDETPLNAGPNEHPAAPYDRYTGDRSLAFWHLNKELALANENFRRDQRNKKTQMVTCDQDGHPLPAQWLIPMRFEPEADGQTVKLDVSFLAETPPTAAGSGQSLGHAPGPIEMSLIGGWSGGNEQVGPRSFRVLPGALGMNDTLIVLAYHAGNEEYEYTEAACEVTFPKMETSGAPQTVEFAAIADRAAGVSRIPLQATATSGLPVEFYVVRGPAEVKGAMLELSVPPPRARYPVRVTVVAFQRGYPGKWQSAPAVEQTFLLTEIRQKSTRDAP
jgi:hypothetical protein